MFIQKYGFGRTMRVCLVEMLTTAGLAFSTARTTGVRLGIDRRRCPRERRPRQDRDKTDEL
jgi:hypothetical protein